MINNKVLIITNKEDLTVDFVIEVLKLNDIDYYRFNTEDIGSNVTVSFDNNGYSILDSKKLRHININDFDSIYFRRPKLPEPLPDLSSGENNFYLTEISTLLEGIYRSLTDVYWLNSVFDIRLIENKPYQLSIAKRIGFLIPEFCISNDYEECKNFIDEYQDCIFKPLKSGLIEEMNDVGKVLYTTKVDENFIDKIITNKGMPIYLQRQIIKHSDIRVTVVGDKVFGAKILSQDSDISMIDWRKSDTILPHKKIEIPSEIMSKCLEICDTFKLNFAAIDFILDDLGKYWFLEINPNGQWSMGMD